MAGILCSSKPPIIHIWFAQGLFDESDKRVRVRCSPWILPWWNCRRRLPVAVGHAEQDAERIFEVRRDQSSGGYRISIGTTSLRRPAWNIKPFVYGPCRWS